MSSHPHSHRSATVVDRGDSVWLYLTATDGTTVIAECWLANRIAAPSYRELARTAEDYRARDLPPPAIREVVTERASAPDDVPLEALELRWSPDGHSVAVWNGAELLGFIDGRERQGYSRGLREVSPWGSPLDEARYRSVFEPGD